jgi:hypothetical protein
MYSWLSLLRCRRQAALCQLSVREQLQGSMMQFHSEYIFSYNVDSSRTCDFG